MDISLIRKTLLELNVNTTIFFFTEYRLVKESWRRQNFLSIIKPLYPKNPVQWSPPDEIRSPKPTKRKEKGKTKFLVSIRLDRDSPTNRWRLLSSPPRGPAPRGAFPSFHLGRRGGNWRESWPHPRRRRDYTVPFPRGRRAIQGSSRTKRAPALGPTPPPFTTTAHFTREYKLRWVFFYCHEIIIIKLI